MVLERFVRPEDIWIFVPAIFSIVLFAVSQLQNIKWLEYLGLALMVFCAIAITNGYGIGRGLLHVSLWFALSWALIRFLRKRHLESE